MEQENLQQAEELNNNEPISPDTLNDETQEEVSVQGQPTPIEKAPENVVFSGACGGAGGIRTHGAVKLN